MGYLEVLVVVLRTIYLGGFDFMGCFIELLSCLTRSCTIKFKMSVPKCCSRNKNCVIALNAVIF